MCTLQRGRVSVGGRPRARIGRPTPPPRTTAAPPRALSLDRGAFSSADVDAYNKEMASRMGWLTDGADPFAYEPARGIAYHHAVYDGSTLVGPQPLTPDHVSALAAEHGVTHILTLQEQGDAERWGVDTGAITAAAAAAGVAHARVPARDFDPASLRGALPAAAGVIHLALSSSSSSPPTRPPRVYVHCTAGLGRSPAAAIAHAMWFRGLGLDAAYAALTATRPCAPKRCAIRGATYDLARTHATPPLEALPPHAFSDLSDAERAIVQAKALARAEAYVQTW